MTNALVVREPSGEVAIYKLFEVGKKVTADPEELRERLDHIESKKKLAEKLGLSGQIALLNNEVRRIKAPVLDMEPMSVEDIALWKAFLPTAYNVTPNSAWGDGRKYEFDKIPHPVLSKFSDCVDEKVFDKYEIWTPEARHIPDPVLVGYIGQSCYMIARWAESDANLITVAGIKRFLFWKWFGPWEGLTINAIIALAIPAVLGGLGTVGGYHDLPKTLETWFDNSMGFVPYFTAASIVLSSLAWMAEDNAKIVWAHTKKNLFRKNRA